MAASGGGSTNDPYVSSYNAHFRVNSELNVRDWQNKFEKMKLNEKTTTESKIIQWAGA